MGGANVSWFLLECHGWGMGRNIAWLWLNEFILLTILWRISISLDYPFDSGLFLLTHTLSRIVYSLSKIDIAIITTCRYCLCRIYMMIRLEVLDFSCKEVLQSTHTFNYTSVTHVWNHGRRIVNSSHGPRKTSEPLESSDTPLLLSWCFNTVALWSSL